MPESRAGLDPFIYALLPARADDHGRTMEVWMEGCEMRVPFSGGLSRYPSCFEVHFQERNARTNAFPRRNAMQPTPTRTRLPSRNIYPPASSSESGPSGPQERAAPNGKPAHPPRPRAFRVAWLAYRCMRMASFGPHRPSCWLRSAR